MKTASELYEAYARAAGWKSVVTGAPLPAYADTPPGVKAGWEAVAACANESPVKISLTPEAAELLAQKLATMKRPRPIIFDSSPPDFYADVVAFHEHFGITYDGRPRLLPDDRAVQGEDAVHVNHKAPSLAEYRRKFLYEEAKEYATATYRGNHSLHLTADVNDKAREITEHLEDALDALVDALYVLLGSAYLHGFTPARFNQAWRRVHAANMRKVRATAEQSARGGSNDIIKPEGWVPPSHIDLVSDHIHQPDAPQEK